MNVVASVVRIGVIAGRRGAFAAAQALICSAHDMFATPAQGGRAPRRGGGAGCLS